MIITEGAVSGKKQRCARAIKISAAVCASLCFTNAGWAAEESAPLKKITVVASNNYLIPKGTGASNAQWHKIGDLQELRNFVSQKNDFRAADDPGVILKALAWVSNNLAWDGIHAARPDECSLDIIKDVQNSNAHYRCVEFGQVLADLLTSLGYVSRQVFLRTENPSYGQGGQGHVATEVWSNQLKKWLFVDPQFSVYPTYRGEHLSFYEMYRLKREGKFDEIALNQTDNYKGGQSGYRDFIRNYFGYIGTNINVDGKKSQIMLELEGKLPYLVFENFQVQNVIFTNDPTEFYYSPNSTFINFEYAEKQDIYALMKKYDLNSDEAINSKLALFAPKPDFKLSFRNNTPQHAFYEYRFSENESWRQLQGDSISWSLKQGLNDIQARSVNSASIPGPVTFLKIRYE
jgi:hypothetical protein